MKTQPTADDAQAMLDRDELNQVKGLQKGRLLSDRRKRDLLAIVTRAKRSKLGEGQQVTTSARRPTAGRPEENYLTKVRRNKVFRMRLQEYTIREMAGEIGAGTKTICEDLKVIDAALNEALDKGTASKILNEKIAELEAMKQMAVTDARDSVGTERAAFIRAAALYYDMQIKLLQDAGMLPKAVVRIGDPEGKPFMMPTQQPAAPVIIQVTYDKDTPAAAKRFGKRSAS